MNKNLTVLIFLIVLFFQAHAQQITVSGKISDENGAGLPGATILVMGSTTGTVTNADGNFTLVVPGGQSVLKISYIGYLTEQITVGNRQEINLSMFPDLTGLEEVVVIGYGAVSRQNLTTAIAKVDPDEVPKAAVSSVSELLAGKAAGLDVTQMSAEPGGNINLSIRGRGNPLIVVDGVIYPNSALEPDNGTTELQGVNRGGIPGLNPNDIESIEVLKDASASIYGIAAANGVILITTKKGKKGKMNVNYNGSHSFVNIFDYLEPLNASDYLTYYNQLYLDDFYYRLRMEPYGAIPFIEQTPPYSEEEIAAAGDGTDWLSEITRPGAINNHSLSVNGGSEKVTYFFSANYFDQQGVLKHSDMDRYNVRSNITFNLSGRVRLNSNINVNRNNYVNSGSGWQAGGAGAQGYGGLQAALAYNPDLPVKNPDGTYAIFSTVPNPVSMLDVIDNTTSNGVFGSLSFDVDIVPQLLTAKVLYGNNNETANREFFIPSDVYWNLNYQSRGSLSENRRQRQQVESFLTLDKSFGSVKLGAMAGYGIYRVDYKDSGLEFTDVLDAINTTNVAASSPFALNSEKSVDKTISYFSRVNIDVNNRYLLMAAIRYDGYDKFFPENKFAVFPSVSLGWKISNEPFLNDVTAINMLKLRASIGVTGEPQGTIGFAGFRSDVNGERQVSAVFNNGAVIYPLYLQTAIDRPDLGWEKTVNKNIGLDFSLFASRLSGSIELYRDDKPNLIYREAPTPSLSMVPTYPINDGHSYRKGYEIALRTINVKSTGFEWDTDINLAHYDYLWLEQSRYTSLAPYQQETDPVGAIYVYETDGIYQPGDEFSGYQPSSARFAGCPIFVDKDNNDTLDSRDVTMYKTQPEITIGLGNVVYFKGFDLSMFVYGQFGAYGWNNSYAWADPGAVVGGVQNGTQAIKEVWSLENTDGTLPGVAWDESTLGLNASIDTWLTKKDFIRCRNITLGYTIDVPGVKRYFSNLRVYVDVQNAFIITKYEGGDPELDFPKPRVSAAAPHPMTRTISVGVNAGF